MRLQYTVLRLDCSAVLRPAEAVEGAVGEGGTPQLPGAGGGSPSWPGGRTPWPGGRTPWAARGRATAAAGRSEVPARSAPAVAGQEHLVGVEDEEEQEEDDEDDHEDSDEEGEAEEDLVEAEVASLQPSTRTFHPATTLVRSGFSSWTIGIFRQVQLELLHTVASKIAYHHKQTCFSRGRSTNTIVSKLVIDLSKKALKRWHA